MKSRVESLAVVNNSAERGIALMSQLNKTLTKNEDEKQKIIQVVENNRKQIPNPKKKKLINFQSL
jgi:exonuclease VII small subunit